MAFDTTQAKSIFQSKSFWGAAIALIAILFPHIWTKIGIQQDVAADKIVGAIGGLLAIYGRLTAKQAVTILGK